MRLPESHNLAHDGNPSMMPLNFPGRPTVIGTEDQRPDISLDQTVCCQDCTHSVALPSSKHHIHEIDITKGIPTISYFVDHILTDSALHCFVSDTHKQDT